MVGGKRSGAGRKPRGEFKGKSAMLTTRITPELRAGLEREARRNARSLSQEIEFRLKRSLQSKPKAGLARERDHNHALGMMAGKLAGQIESLTGMNWREDRFSHEALRAGLAALLARLAPPGEAKMPAAIRAQIELLPEIGEQISMPEGVGRACAYGLFDQIRMAEPPPVNHPPNEYYAEGFYWMPWVREKLNSDAVPGEFIGIRVKEKPKQNGDEE
jgi:TraY domain